MKQAIVLALGVVAVLACGGQVAGSGGGADGGPSGHDGGGGGTDAASGTDAPTVFVDAATTVDAGGGITCIAGPGDGTSCSLSASETCSDGTTYQVACDCPSTDCSCSEMSTNMGGSSGGGPGYTGCPSCEDVAAAWAQCGFPH